MRESKIIPWESAPEDTLYSVSEVSATPLRVLPPSSVYRLISLGILRAVRIRGRLFLSKRGITKFIASHEKDAA